MSDDIARERHEMLLEKIGDLKADFKEDIAGIRRSVADTCAALTKHADDDDERYKEFQTVQQTVGTAQKIIKVGAAAVGALGVKEVWNFFKH